MRDSEACCPIQKIYACHQAKKMKFGCATKSIPQRSWRTGEKLLTAKVAKIAKKILNRSER